LKRPLGKLRKRADFLRLSTLGNKYVTKGFVLQSSIRNARPKEGIRIGFVVSKRIGNAVIRNKTKRRFRSIADSILGRMGQPNTDYVLIARQGSTRLKFKILENDLVDAIGKLSKKSL